MRARILIICGIVLAICAWLLFHRKNAAVTSNPPEVENPSTNLTPSQPPVTPTHLAQNHSPVNPSAAQTSPATGSDLELSNALSQQMLADWQRPIDFYGKVIDENTNPVAEANITFGWSEFPNENGVRRATTTSDSEGLFSLRDKRGPSLDVSVSKEGYYSSHNGQWGFIYAHGKDKYVPDSLNPVIFILHKKGNGEPLIHIGGIGLHRMRDYVLAPDGRPTDISLTSGRQAGKGEGDLEIQFQAGKPLENFPSRVTWQCRVSIPNGGLIPTSEEYPFSAPEAGYYEADDWSITATNWTETVQKQYYVKLPNGDYGRVDLRIIGAPDQPFFRLESWLNPSGSRNLEPTP